jgi:hypothetical protein
MEEEMALDRESSQYARLLADPNFDFKFFDDAVMEYAQRNMGKILESQPEMCKYFLTDDRHINDVAKAVDVTSPQAEEVMKTIEGSTNWNANYAYKTIAPRLVEAGKSNLLTLAPSKLYMLEASSIKYLDIEVLEVALANVKFSEYASSWDWAQMKAIIERFPADRLKVLAEKKWIAPGTRLRQQVGSKMVSFLAQKLPLSELGEFADKFLPEFKDLECMRCGKLLKSKPGYTLHRQCCDEKDEFPSLPVAIGRRLLNKE